MADTSPSEPREIPAGRVARGEVRAPPSKSHAIRALICAALAHAPSDPPSRRELFLPKRQHEFADDVVRTADALRSLGFDVREPRLVPGFDVGPAGGRIPASSATLDVGGSATALRFLAAVCALGPGPYTITGSPQLRARPAGAIVPALRTLGVSVKGECGGGDGVRPPLIISGGPLRGSDVEVDASSSSHALSALLLVGPHLPSGLLVRPHGAIASRAYVDLTVNTLRDFGVRVEEHGIGWYVAPSELRGRGPERIEEDWSCASYLLAAAAVTDGHVTAGVDGSSVQPDRRIVEILDGFGASVRRHEDRTVATGRASRPVDVDLSDSPDLAPLVGALGCLVEGTTRVRGAAHLRIKETDRIAAVVRCARALGCRAEEHPDGFEVTGPARHGALIDPEGDHRIAMAFAVAGLAVPGTRIADPGCVAKSYPTFWQDLDGLVGPP